MALALIPGERIFEKTCPHLFSMFYLYLAWLYIAGVGIATIYFRPGLWEILGATSLGTNAAPILFWVIWSLAILIPGLILAFWRIHWSWLLLAIGLVLVGLLLENQKDYIAAKVKIYLETSILAQVLGTMLKEDWPWVYEWCTKIHKQEIANYWLMGIGSLGFILANIYRRSHQYYITNRRVITRFGFFITRERDLLYSKIEDLVVHRDPLGRFFNFGTLIPISASGIGTGTDQAIFMVGGEQKLPIGPSLKVIIGGGHSITVPKAPSFYSLYGIPNPEKLRNLILQEMERREYHNRKDSHETEEKEAD